MRATFDDPSTPVARRRLWAAAGGSYTRASASTGRSAVGGRWLLATVGRWAVQLPDRAPSAGGLALTLVAVLKVAAAAAPLLNDSHWLPAPRLWWGLSLLAGLTEEDWDDQVTINAQHYRLGEGGGDELGSAFSALAAG